MWTCPRCKRSFSKTNQSHSCVIYPLEKHLEGREGGTALFDELVKRMRGAGLSFNIDSVPCCIHLVTRSAFAAVWVLKDKIKIDFRLGHEMKSRRIGKTFKMSANRYLYYLEINNKEEIDRELISWIKESHRLVK